MLNLYKNGFNIINKMHNQNGLRKKHIQINFLNVVKNVQVIIIKKKKKKNDYKKKNIIILIMYQH